MQGPEVETEQLPKKPDNFQQPSSKKPGDCKRTSGLSSQAGFQDMRNIRNQQNRTAKQP